MRQVVALVFLLATAAVRAAAEELVQFEPATYRINDAVGVEESNVIRGLLKAKRSCPKHYGYCKKTGVCCPLGGQCCTDHKCCRSGQWCSSPGHCCYDNQNSCDRIGCCSKSENCCKGGACCPRGYYCVRTTSGRIGCCPNGKLCYGPAENVAEGEGTSNGAVEVLSGGEVAGNESKNVVEAEQDE